MPAPHPRMHGLTHVAGGPDPVPGLIPYPTGDTIDKAILAALPAGFWKLNESSGSVAADSSGHGQDLTATSPALDPLWGHAAGPPGEQAADMENGTGGIGGTAAVVKRDWPAITGDFTAGIWVSHNSNAFTYTMGQGNPARSGGAGWQLGVGGSPNPTKPYAYMHGLGGIDALNPLPDDTWAFLACTFDAAAGTLNFYVDGLLEGSLTGSYVPVTSSAPLWIGHDSGVGGFAVFVCNCVCSYGFLVNRVLSGTELLNISGAAAAGSSEGTEGLVVGIDENGDVGWVHPTVEVQHGGGEPDETPRTGDGSAYAGGDTSSSGWHLDAHFETVVLYDANPARFDVPTKKWVRVPFDTVRSWRRWEVEVDGDFKDAWLPDDRGLTAQAKQGILHITADMAGDQTVEAWCSIEWPVIDYTKVPDDDPEPIHDDAYVRALRIVDLSHGYVLRAAPGDSKRRFFEWPINQPADGTAEWVDYTGDDNPYPIYPVWAGRPLHLPDPYPKLSEDLSGVYYAPRKTFTMVADLAAGDNLCLQAWQDTQWTLRFSTDTFRDAVPLIPAYLRRPYLSVSFSYDPETIDHTTGKLL
jgi:hypothetical protein